MSSPAPPPSPSSGDEEESVADEELKAMSSEESGDAMSPSVAESCSLYASPPGTKFTFDVDTLPQSQRFSNRIAQAVINTRCSDRCKFALSVVLGCLATCMQVPGIFLLNWVIVYEPRAVNQTDDQGELMEAPFVYNLGYFGACRSPFENIENLTAYKNLDPEAVRADFPRLCVLNPFFTEDDLSDFSLAANLILQRLAVPALLHIPGTVLCSIAVLLSIAGELKRDRRTIIAAMFFISGGLIIFVAVLQVICAVDDEMAPRLKTNAAGEPSLFHYHYGPSFLSASLSFLPLQMCVYLQTSSYFARFPLPFDKSVVVPGLSQMISEVITRSRNGLQPLVASGPSSACSFNRRASRCSHDYAFGAVHQEVRRLNPPLSASMARPSVHICI